MITITPIPAFTDNYIWCLHDGTHAAVVDPGDAAVVTEFLAKNQLTLTDILITHHHADHIGGLRQLAGDGINVYGPVSKRIPHLTQSVSEGEKVVIASLGAEFKVMEVPGHTTEHIAFYSSLGLFCGDTLFSGGCGRLFEGTPAQMLNAFERFKQLPDNTAIYCTHEYTEANLRFALDLCPNDEALNAYMNKVKQTRAIGKPTLPSKISLEKEINLYMRVGQPEIVDAVAQRTGKLLQSPVATFAAVRELKDNY